MKDLKYIERRLVTTKQVGFEETGEKRDYGPNKHSKVVVAQPPEVQGLGCS
jgi:hypothetical protein